MCVKPSDHAGAGPRGARGDEGFALIAVMISMGVLTLFLLATLGYAVHEMPQSRKDQDAKTAQAAAQAGLEDFLARLNSDGDYWQSTDSANLAFSTGKAIPGTGGDKGSFTYQVLSTVQDVGDTGTLRVQVTGRSRGVTRKVTTSLRPVGFLKYVYYTDIEATDPALYTQVVSVNGATSSSNGDYSAKATTLTRLCSQYYYAGRKAPVTYSASTTDPLYATNSGGHVTTTTNGTVVTVTCSNIQWTTGDVVDGPLHSNDALRVEGSARFTSEQTETGWLPTSPLPATPGHAWWGGGTPDAAGYQPTGYPRVDLPDSNSKLLDAAVKSGCVYTGATKITFAEGVMKVKSPNTTTSSRPGCFTPALRADEQVISPIPPAVYVRAASGTCTGVGFPIASEATTSAGVVVGPGPNHNPCNANAYVSGVLAGRTTIGAANDIVIIGDTTYRNGTTGTDVLGLIADNYIWVYKPVNSSGTNLLPTAATPTTPSMPEVHNIQAAILSVGHSFVVQSYAYGDPLAGKLNVTGSISQKYRGPVGTGTAAAASHGYLKNYVYDPRLLRIPPPFFLQPRQAPWVVGQVSG